jgi:hypothetical protein
MQAQLSGAPSHRASTGADDRDTEALVLHQILLLYPEALTFDELVREMIKGSPDFSQWDDVHRAVRELTGAGLLHRIDALVLPTRAACYLAGIGIDW